jgi:hypothetical protein
VGEEKTVSVLEIKKITEKGHIKRDVKINTNRTVKGGDESKI